MRKTRYQAIADDLRHRIGVGELTAGRLLPSEADLSKEFGASRVTVRRALEVLRDEDLVESRQGLGWLVGSDPVRQQLGRLGTIEEQLTAGGQTSERRVLDFRFMRPPTRVREVLGGGTVLRVKRLNLAEGHPFALVTVWCPEEHGAELSRADVERSSFYDLLGVELGGATQTIGASAASESEAGHLDVPSASPVLRCERITRAADGTPLLMSQHVFPAHLTEFVVELTQVESSLAPSGIRLVG